MNWIRETLRCTLCCRFLLSCRPDFQSVKCLLKLKPNSVSWDWEPGTAVFDALFSEEEISCKQWLLALQLQQYITACRQKKRTFYATCKCTIRIQYPFKKKSVYSGTVIRYGFCSLWTYGKLSGSIFFIWYQNWTKKPLETGKKIWIRIPCSLVRWSSSLWSHSLFRQWLWEDTAMPHENQTPSATTLSLSISNVFGIVERYLRTWRYPDPPDYH